MNKGSTTKQILLLVFFGILIIFYGYTIYSTNRANDQTQEPVDFNMTMLETITIGDGSLENVSICLNSHVIYGDEFKLYIENNHTERIVWGYDWETEKLEQDQWVKQKFMGTIDIMYTLEPGHIGRMDFQIDDLNSGIYRITKKIGVKDVPTNIPIIFYIEKSQTPVNITKKCRTTRLNISKFDEPETFEDLYQDIIKISKYQGFELDYCDDILGLRVDSYREFIEYAINSSYSTIFFINRTNLFGASLRYGDGEEFYTWFKVLEQVEDESNIPVNLPSSYLWDMEPKILLDKHTPDAWWLEGHMDGEPTPDVLSPSIRLRRALERNESVVVENFGQIYVNDYNNTVFVVTKSLDANVTEAFLDIMKPGPSVSVIFRQGYASWVELEEWVEAIQSEIENIEASGVEWSFFGKSENATIRIGIINISMDDVEIILELLDGKVPPGILLFELGSKASTVN